MAEQEPTQGSGINYGVVGFGIILLVLVVAAIPDTFVRVLAAAGIMLVTFWWSQSRQEPDVENPLLEQLHEQYGLDRRKYGHLRASTDSLLDHVRQMNRIAIEGREGKLASRHAQAELDRLAAKMRDVVDDIRKTAGVPTPMESAARGRSAQPEVVIPKATPGQEAETTAPARPAPAPQPPRDADEALDELEVQARAEARSREQKGGGA